MYSFFLFLVSTVLADPLVTLSSLTTPQADGDPTPVIAVQGHPTSLPCDITPPRDDEQVYLVLWYRQDEGEPIYSYDARSGGGIDDVGRRWSDDRAFGLRGHFQVKPHPALLHVEDIQAAEAGVYRCRVDFKTAPTRNSLVNLTVIIPPSKPTVFDESGREVHGVVGPYTEGSTAILKCISAGGDPRPEVTWWRSSHLIDSSYETTFSYTVQNTLTLKGITRRDLGATFICQAYNNNVSMPATTKITLDLKFRPETVSIVTPKEPLSAGKPYRLECLSAGSRPAATITWWKNNKFMGKTESKILDNGNVTMSVIRFVPHATDHGKILTCRAENTDIANTAIQDEWKLVVHHAPHVSLSFGANLNPDNIAEGNDVYFECKIKANPEVYKVIWLHNDVMVQPSKSSGVIISSSSLVLQSVRKEMAGNYSCVASNLEGDSQSNNVELKVKYRPLCGHPLRIVHGIGRGQKSKIVCPVLSHPPPSNFDWAFNNSVEMKQIESKKFSVNGSHSELVYTPMDDDDFGLLYCWGSNEMGKMEFPCTFKLIPAGPPDPPTNCSVVNQTTESLEVECLPGFNGGLEQRFLLEVADAQTGVLLANASDKAPVFQVSGLNAGRGLRITIFAVNSNGRSQSAVLEGFTLKVAELQVESPVPLEFTPVLGILAGVVLTLLVLAFFVILVLRLKYKTSKQQPHSSKPGGPSNGMKSAIPTEKDAEEYFCLTSNDHEIPTPTALTVMGGGKNPDVIPNRISEESEEPQPERTSPYLPTSRAINGPHIGYGADTLNNRKKADHVTFAQLNPHTHSLPRGKTGGPDRNLTINPVSDSPQRFFDRQQQWVPLLAKNNQESTL